MSQQEDSLDPWSLDAIQASSAPEDGPVLSIETIEGAEPLDDQMGVYPTKKVPDALYEPLFGQPEPTEAEIEHYGSREAVPLMRTYAILDAAKAMFLPDKLNTSGLEYRCLFKGDAFDELKEVAPWLVRLEDENGFTTELFTAGTPPWYLWDKEPGIYIRSRAKFDEMWRHFRKFTRVQNRSEKWYYFRFWDPEVAQVNFDHISTLKEVWPNWFFTQSGAHVFSCVVLRRSGVINLFSHPGVSFPSDLRSFRITESEVEKFRRSRLEKSLDDIKGRLSKHDPEKSPAEIESIVNQVVKRFSSFGFRSKASFFALAWCELRYGPIFERKLSEPVMKQIENSSRDEGLRINDIRAVLERDERSIT